MLISNNFCLKNKATTSFPKHQYFFYLFSLQVLAGFARLFSVWCLHISNSQNALRKLFFSLQT